MGARCYEGSASVRGKATTPIRPFFHKSEPRSMGGVMTTQKNELSSSTDQSKVKREGYQSYMLRLWQVNGDPVTWRASLEDPRTGDNQVFARIEDLCAYLKSL